MSTAAAPKGGSLAPALCFPALDYGVREPDTPLEQTSSRPQALSRWTENKLRERAEALAWAAEHVTGKPLRPRHGRFGLHDLGPDDCRYPTSAEPYLFCGRAQVEGCSYCNAHRRRCYQLRASA